MVVVVVVNGCVCVCVTIICPQSSINNSTTDCTKLLQQRKRCHSKMLHMINSQSDIDCVSLTVTESKIRYSRLIFDDNKVMLICLSA